MGCLQFERSFGAEAIGGGHILAGDGRHLDTSFALLEADFAHLEGHIDFAALGAVGGRTVLSTGDDVQWPSERLLGERTEITFEFQRGAGVAQSKLDVARS